MKLKVCFLLVFLAGSYAVLGQTEIRCEKIEGCDADIAILVDKSGSITAPEDGGAPENWGLLKHFIYDIMRSSNFGEADDEGALYSVLFFANRANLKVKFDTCKDMACMERTIEAVNAPGGETHTDAALREAMTNIFSPAGGDRAQSPDIILLITDGVPNPYIKAELDATVAEVKSRNIRIIGIGIGNNVDHDIMRGIVTFPPDENYFQIVDFSAVRAELENILGRACVFCTVDCFGQWTPWSPCPVSCGTGTVTRTRQKFEVADAACAPGETSQTKQCDAGPCKEGCDPKTIDFGKVAYDIEPAENVVDAEMVGTWFLYRYYLAPRYGNVSQELYDQSVVTPKSPEEKIYTYNRDKLKDCCNEREGFSFKAIKNGVLEVDFRGTLRRYAVVYTNALFAMTINCHFMDKETETCGDYEVSFWSRCPKARPQDIAKAEYILRKLCYPHMKRYLDIKHKMDCAEKDPWACGCKKDNGGYAKNKCGSRPEKYCGDMGGCKKEEKKCGGDREDKEERERRMDRRRDRRDWMDEEDDDWRDEMRGRVMDRMRDNMRDRMMDRMMEKRSSMRRRYWGMDDDNDDEDWRERWMDRRDKRMERRRDRRERYDEDDDEW